MTLFYFKKLGYQPALKKQDIGEIVKPIFVSHFAKGTSTNCSQNSDKHLRMENLFKIFIGHFATGLHLTNQTIGQLCSQLSILDLEKKHILIRENQRHDYAYFLVKGAVRAYYLKDGVEVNTWFALENNMVGSIHNFKGDPSRETIELIENSTLISINMRHIRSLMVSNIQVTNFITAIIIDYALFLEDKIYFSQMMNSSEKYLVLFDKEPQLFQRIPLTYLASFLGISRETLSRLRAK